MPTISIFWGILIQMWWNDHNPPHFHCKYGEYQALIDIETLTILNGDMPKKTLNAILEWAQLHQAELMENWRLCQQSLPPNKIQPLE
jgi:Domain of unknown function (DUF4160)